MKYKVIKEFDFLGNKVPIGLELIEKQEHFIINHNGVAIKLTKEFVLNSEYFSNNDIKISEVSSDEDSIVKNWRLQLDLKCSMNKLKEIEIAVRNTVNTILNE